MICPRCGEKGTPYTRRAYNKTYLYYLHHYGDGEKRRCYIGPIEGYTVAAKLYQISIPHAFDIMNRLEVLEELLEYFAETCRYLGDTESAGDEEKKIREMCGKADGDRRAREECRRAEEERKIREACRGAREAVREFIKSTG